MILKSTLVLRLILFLTGTTAFADATMDQLVKSRFSGAGKFVR